MKASFFGEKAAKKRFISQDDLKRLAVVLAEDLNREIERGRPISKDLILQTLEREYGKEGTTVIDDNPADAGSEAG